MYVPPGQSPPFEVVDELHHGAWLIITAALGLVVSLVCFLIRLYVRLMLIPPFARDDWVLLGATAVAVLQASLVFYACSRGFGTSISLLEDGRLNQIQTLIATSDIIALIIIYLSKCCVVAIYLRLTPQKRHNRAAWATLVVCTLWVIPAIFIVLVNCELNTPWRGGGGQCPNLYKKWQYIAAVDVMTEVILFILAVILLKGLFMSVRRRLAIGFAFIFRFPLIILSIIHILSLRTALKSDDTTLASVEPTVWMQVELHYALVACSVFCIRPFMAAVSTNYGTAGDSTLESSASRSNTKEGSKGSGSGSNADQSSRSASRATRSRSHSHMRHKRPGTAIGPVGMHASGSRKAKTRTIKAHGALISKNQWRKDADIRHEERVPVCRSMFPLGTWESYPKLERGKQKHGAQGSDSTETDLIELVPRPHTQHSHEPSGDSAGEDRMVIRKEVRYSIQYEDENRIAKDEKAHDASAYV
ncbi:unnamed protein product [Penicillium salamii]|uniref:Rhodopsin domain-containing protein n=1 Tax=Penicillium salamii TaxID=1612424 RepID=A0A9W4NXW7_9EURO|nr:unnamed protein product [Penicillium salamii]CAG8332379.1 unnamed protein product [Penicillium salamii]CAG8359727.1 unnamed protein product [Penicillium salamii]CAG8372017.1 unnamed protein product [Penicillium salamii]CAG8412337.1 unnamed protein product [Penicillium salamii]